MRRFTVLKIPKRSTWETDGPEEGELIPAGYHSVATYRSVGRARRSEVRYGARKYRRCLPRWSSTRDAIRRNINYMELTVERRVALNIDAGYITKGRVASRLKLTRTRDIDANPPGNNMDAR